MTDKECEVNDCTNDAVDVTPDGYRCQYHMQDVLDDSDLEEAWMEAYYTDEEDDDADEGR